MDPSEARALYAKMSPREREELAKKLDEQLDAYMEGLERTGEKYMDGWSEDNWEEEMEKHPFFAKSIDETQELSPLLKGIQVNITTTKALFLILKQFTNSCRTSSTPPRRTALPSWPRATRKTATSTSR